MLPSHNRLVRNPINNANRTAITQIRKEKQNVQAETSNLFTQTDSYPIMLYPDRYSYVPGHSQSIYH